MGIRTQAPDPTAPRGPLSSQVARSYKKADGQGAVPASGGRLPFALISWEVPRASAPAPCAAPAPAPAAVGAGAAEWPGCAGETGQSALRAWALSSGRHPWASGDSRQAPAAWSGLWCQQVHRKPEFISERAAERTLTELHTGTPPQATHPGGALGPPTTAFSCPACLIIQ